VQWLRVAATCTIQWLHAEDEGQEETDNEPMTAPMTTPAPSSTAPTPAAPTPAEQHESDDNKIGEEDLEDDDDMSTPVAPALGTPGSVLAVPVHDATERETTPGDGTGAGGDLPAEMMSKKQDTEQAIEQMMANRQGAESCVALALACYGSVNGCPSCHSVDLSSTTLQLWWVTSKRYTLC
jgi:hypothetical protein